jgi:purine-binding chemotaxis protein CheW
MVIGMVVDKVSQVLKVAADNIAPAPQTVKGPGSEYVSGVAMLEEKLVVLLDIDWILNEVERNSMAEAA